MSSSSAHANGMGGQEDRKQRPERDSAPRKAGTDCEWLCMPGSLSYSRGYGEPQSLNEEE